MTPANTDRRAEAFAALEPLLEALDSDALRRVNVDLQEASSVILGALPTFERFRPLLEALPAEAFDIERLDRLESIAWALQFVRVHLDRARSGATQASLPADLVERATSRRGRMLRVVDYYLAEDPDLAGEVTAIRAGSGHVDLADDLSRLADLYDDHRDLIGQDTLRYRDDDAQAARDDADAIIRTLAGGQDSTLRRWQQTAHRLWTLTHRDYNDVRDTLTWRLRHDPEQRAELLREATSLYRGGRPRRVTTDEDRASTPDAT